LHVLPANDRNLRASLGKKWIDPRAPDGVTLLAPHEQYQPTDYPGLTTGDAPKAMELFDLSADPSEQHDVSADHPDVVKRLRAEYDSIAKDAPKETKNAASIGKKRSR
jgi:hypothetical protein